MRKFKVVWYWGPICDVPNKNDKRFCIIDEHIVEAENVNFDSFKDILSIAEQIHFSIDIMYGVRCIYWSDYQWYYDYGSHSKFVYVEELKDENV